ncbi:MAG: hypothetical protein R3E95_03925 [Thiolinea sp.]
MHNIIPKPLLPAALSVSLLVLSVLSPVVQADSSLWQDLAAKTADTRSAETTGFATPPRLLQLNEYALSDRVQSRTVWPTRQH